MNTQYNDPKGAAGALKTPLGLIPSYAMEQTAWVHKLGAEKYGPYNWRKTGVCASTYVNAILRHLNAWRDGETLDPESGISHLAHVACSCNILLDAGFCGTLQDDRNITPPNAVDKLVPVEAGYRLLEVGESIQEGDEFYVESVDEWFFTHIGHLSLHNTGATKYRRKVGSIKDPAPVETEYRLLEVGEFIKEGDEYYCGLFRNWQATNSYGGLVYTSEVKYRRKVRANEPDLCTCGRIKINHFMLGLICEDCEIQWQDPY